MKLKSVMVHLFFSQRLLPLICFFILGFLSTSGAQNKNGCDTPGCRQFDFWIGEWNLEWQRNDGQIEKGSNSVKKTLDECVIIEQFNGNSNPGLKGMSISTFDANRGKWRQTWVDNQGNHIHYCGEMVDGKMVLERVVKVDGQTFHQRMVYYNITENAIDWDLETSTDNGKTWRLTWRIHYKRKS
jgi:hypothetical protein